MKVEPFHCDCPEKLQDLSLIETRFVGQRCFAELQCTNCRTYWTAEIGPRPGTADPLSMEIEDQPGWRVLSLSPRLSS